jgi:hypothetical protein
MKRQNNVKNLTSLELFQGNVTFILYMRLHNFTFPCPLYCWRRRRGNNTRTLIKISYLKGIPLVSTGRTYSVNKLVNEQYMNACVGGSSVWEGRNFFSHRVSGRPCVSSPHYRHHHEFQGIRRKNFEVNLFLLCDFYQRVSKM